ncbi:hypothetical protein BDK51DRAFT_45422 [Blyttiomyces helicus]|uniref:Uncharacterized protein n=1 Tax=Blyttiomyces helicus TaxID=388810 RepID=A0A4P9WGX7_9FUNG|nr:hypothetical protein BDK51DRAFT_45422 [Blyttiomyces helicus]|eukprot:RKO90638.1 hypothetical protein BDK51DRAFT_45422 [Blyttiomyces helicus]
MSIENHKCVPAHGPRRGAGRKEKNEEKPRSGVKTRAGANDVPSKHTSARRPSPETLRRLVPGRPRTRPRAVCEGPPRYSHCTRCFQDISPGNAPATHVGWQKQTPACPCHVGMQPYLLGRVFVARHASTFVRLPSVAGALPDNTAALQPAPPFLAPTRVNPTAGKPPNPPNHAKSDESWRAALASRTAAPLGGSTPYASMEVRSLVHTERMRYLTFDLANAELRRKWGKKADTRRLGLHWPTQVGCHFVRAKRGIAPRRRLAHQHKPYRKGRQVLRTLPTLQPRQARQADDPDVVPPPFKSEMNPLQLELHPYMKYIIGVNLLFSEYPDSGRRR